MRKYSVSFLNSVKHLAPFNTIFENAASPAFLQLFLWISDCPKLQFVTFSGFTTAKNLFSDILKTLLSLHEEALFSQRCFNENA
jgi:hypothetical protein